MPSAINLINKIIKLSAGDDPCITPDDLADFIARRTYYEMEIDYDRPADDIIKASNYVFVYGSSGDIFQPNNSGIKKVRFQYHKNSVSHDIFHAATGFELISFYEKFKKPGLMALGSCQKSGDIRYFPSVSYDKRLIISTIKTSGEVIYRPLVIIRYE